MLRPHHLLTAIVPFGLAIAVCYLFGYWSRFGINALEYVDIADVFKLAIFPMLVTAACLVVGTLIGLWTAHLPTGRFGRVLLVLFKSGHPHRIGMASLVLAIAVFMFWWEPSRWMLAAMLMTVAVVSARSSPLVKAALGDGPLVFTVLYYGTFLLLIAVHAGRVKAESAMQGLGESVVDTLRTGEHLVGDKDAPVIFLGALGDARFFYETCTGQTVVMESGQRLFLVARQTQPLDQPYGWFAEATHKQEGVCKQLSGRKKATAAT